MQTLLYSIFYHNNLNTTLKNIKNNIIMAIIIYIMWALNAKTINE